MHQVQNIEVVLSILKYLKGTLDTVFLFANKRHIQVVVHTDVDWVKSVTDRKSTSGYCIFVQGNPMTW